MNLTRVYLNITSVSLPTQWEMTKAKRAYVKEYNKCACCGHNKTLEVHHIKPVHLFPSLACDHSNFITLCRNCHCSFGHFRNFRTKWNPGIVVFAEEMTSLLEYCYDSYEKTTSLNTN